MFTAVRTPRVYEHIVEQIERVIFDGRLGNGDRLPPERTLVRQFRASRVAVREALRILEHRGLVEVRSGASGGHFVRHADARLLRRDFATLLRLARISIGELTEARLLVEPGTARLAAQRASAADVDKLRAILPARAAPSPGPPREVNIGFHRLVAETAKNALHAVLVAALMELETEIVPRRALAAPDQAAMAEAHAEIVAAIAAHQPEAARQAMERHLVDLQRRLVSAAGRRHRIARTADLAL